MAPPGDFGHDSLRVRRRRPLGSRLFQRRAHWPGDRERAQGAKPGDHPRRARRRQAVVDRRQSHRAEHRRVLRNDPFREARAPLRAENGLRLRLHRRVCRHDLFLSKFPNEGRHLDDGPDGLLSAQHLRRLRDLSARAVPHAAAQHGREFLLQRRALHRGHRTDHAGWLAEISERKSRGRAPHDRRRALQG